MMVRYPYKMLHILQHWQRNEDGKDWIVVLNATYFREMDILK